MKLVFSTGEIILPSGSFIEYHDGREGHSFNNDCSICFIDSEEEAMKLKTQLEKLYPYPKYRMDLPFIIQCDGDLFEVAFSVSDFAPFRIL